MSEYTIFKGNIDSTIPLLIAIGPRGVERIEFSGDATRFRKRLPPGDWTIRPFNKEIQAWGTAYQNGAAKKFPYRLHFTGTEFQESVWKAMRKIPYGEIRTYKWIAEKIGRPNAIRAVGNACGANPLPLVIPCHRVVASNGFGGFSSGLNIKKKLLTLEANLNPHARRRGP